MGSKDTKLNDAIFDVSEFNQPTSSGISCRAKFVPVKRTWQPGPQLYWCEWEPSAEESTTPDGDMLHSPAAVPVQREKKES